jgi:hypothetical protein
VQALNIKKGYSNLGGDSNTQVNSNLGGDSNTQVNSNYLIYLNFYYFNIIIILLLLSYIS